MSNKVWVGVDPGKNGAMAFIFESGKDPVTIPWDNETFIDYMQNCQVNENDTVVCLEHVGPMPKQGVKSTFNFGDEFGYIKGVLECCRIPYELVRPQKWKKEFSVTADKKSSIAVCKRLFPGVSLRRTEKCTTDHDGMAEALLMAEYARRRFK